MSDVTNKLFAKNRPITDGDELITFIKKNGGKLNSIGEERVRELFDTWGKSRFKRTRSHKFPYDGLAVDIVYTGSGAHFPTLFYVKRIKLIGIGNHIGSNSYNISWKDEKWDLLDEEITLDEKRSREREF